MLSILMEMVQTLFASFFGKSPATLPSLLKMAVESHKVWPLTKQGYISQIKEIKVQLFYLAIVLANNLYTQFDPYSTPTTSIFPKEVATTPNLD
jgi:hypothetical protein